MATQVTPKKNSSFTFYLSLRSQSNPKIHQASPTLSAGDVKVAVDDAAPANITTLPVVDADFTKRIKVDLSAAETNGDNITLIFSDAAGSEWCDLTVNIQTTARQIDDLAFPVTSGRGLLVEADNMVHADLKEWLGTAPLALIAQAVQVDVFSISQDATAANNAESFFDGTGYAGTGNVIPTVTTVTGTVNAAVVSMGAGVITAATFGAGAIDSAALAANVVTDIWMGTALTESYRGTGATGTPAQLIYEILANIVEFGIVGTTKTARKLDGTTTAKTYTLNSSSAPTDITEAT